jgi:hypothetical protein
MGISPPRAIQSMREFYWRLNIELPDFINYFVLRVRIRHGPMGGERADWHTLSMVRTDEDAEMMNTSSYQAALL